jgi:hypothetical protein
MNQNLGFDLSRFPSLRAIKLVEKLAQAIRRKDKKSDFLKNMTHKIRQKGYPQF